MIRKYVYFFVVIFCCLSISCINERCISYDKENDIILVSKILLQYDFYRVLVEGNEFILYERYKRNISDQSSLYGFREVNRVEIPKEVRDKKFFQKLIHIEKREDSLYYVEYRSISGINIGILFTENRKINIDGLQLLERLHGSSWNRVMYFESY